MRDKIIFGLLLGFVGSALLGYQAPDPKAYERLRDSIPEILKSFVLYNSSGQAGPPEIAVLKKWPLGVVLVFTQPKEQSGGLTYVVQACSAFHLKEGDIYTHKKCLVPGQPYAPVLYLVYYDRKGKRVEYRVPKTQVDGDLLKLDVPASLSNDFHTLDVDLGKMDPKATWRDLSRPQQVIVYAFDLLPSKSGGFPTMIFSPRVRCLASLQAPKVQMVQKGGGPNARVLDINLKFGDGKSPLLHIDNCMRQSLKGGLEDGGFEGGNMGALIVKSSDPTQVLGVFESPVQNRFLLAGVKSLESQAKDVDLQKFLSQATQNDYRYTGNDGKAYAFTPVSKPNSGLFAVGQPFKYPVTGRPPVVVQSGNPRQSPPPKISKSPMGKALPPVKGQTQLPVTLPEESRIAPKTSGQFVPKDRTSKEKTDELKSKPRKAKDLG